jgi:hypothetical protein
LRASGFLQLDNTVGCARRGSAGRYDHPGARVNREAFGATGEARLFAQRRISPDPIAFAIECR